MEADAQLRRLAPGGRRSERDRDVPRLPDPRPPLSRRPRLPARAGVPRGRDPVPDPLDSGGGARLPRPEPAPAGQLLRPAAVAAALQAAADGGGLRALLPDRPLLP